MVMLIRYAAIRLERIALQITVPSSIKSKTSP
jgi:hypothetical protein